jgi:hypothetical protein
MKNFWKWFLGITAAMIVLFFLPTVFRWFFFPAYGYGMMGGWHHSMMGGFSFLGMRLMWLFPLGVLALLVLGIVWLVNNLTGIKPALLRTCPSCGRPAQTDWKNCPYCGSAL